jgi:hypothetical protein
MALTGKRDDWEKLLRRNDETGEGGAWGLKPAHVQTIRKALKKAPADSEMVEVDATASAARQVKERTEPDDHAQMLEAIVLSIADADESWWIHRARSLGLMSIVPIELWPRVPEQFIRPPGYLHTFGPEPPAEYVAGLEKWKADLERSKASKGQEQPDA